MLPLKGLPRQPLRRPGPRPPHPHARRLEAGSSQFLRAYSPDGCVAATPQAQLRPAEWPHRGGQEGLPQETVPRQSGLSEGPGLATR